MNDEERVAAVTILVLISCVHGAQSKHKNYFLEELVTLWPMSKEIYPLENLPNKIPFSHAVNILKNLNENNMGKFFELVSSFITVDGPPTPLEILYVAKLLEKIDRTPDEFDDVSSRLKTYLSGYPSLCNKYY
jgi:hypothetical protein